MSLKLLLVFALTEFLMSLTPGPAVLLVVSQGMKTGFKPSLRGTLGIEVGNGIYFGLSALGLGALLVASSNLFEVIRWLGVAYLILLGLKMLIFKRKAEDKIEPVVTTRESAKLFFQGLVTQLVNPRALVFFTALLPQFISPGNRVVQQFVVLGIVSSWQLMDGLRRKVGGSYLRSCRFCPTVSLEHAWWVPVQALLQ